MQRLSAALLMLAGAALGGYTYLPSSQNDAEKLAEVTRISAAPDRDVRSSTGAANGAVISSDRTFSPVAPLWAAEQVGQSSAPLTAGAAKSDAAKPAAPWTAVVTAEPSNAGKFTSSKPGDAETRVELTRDLQRELQRVGCYGGEISGTWTPSTKRAMASFMDRVNATLPIEEPDYILLTLVQGHKAAACGTECPAGQVSTGGRCVPQAVVAQATRKSQREDERRLAEVQKSQARAQQQERVAQELRAAEQQRRVADARRADDERRAFDQKREQQRVADAQRDSQRVADVKRVAGARKAAQQKAQVLAQAVAAATPEVLPWLKEDQPRTTTTSTGQSAATSRPAPLPGMMAMGGPAAAKPEMPASVAAVTPDRGPRPDMGRDWDRLAATGNTLEDNATDAPAIVPPAPARAVRPLLPEQITNPAGVQGAPGSKSGVSVRGQATGLQQYRAPSAYKVRPAKIVHRPRPPVLYAAPRPRPYAYASNGGIKIRRGVPRPGTMPYFMLQAMGGIY